MSTELILSQHQIENRIFTIRDMQVMIDRDIAEIYHIETRSLNQAVKRNIDRFPKDFMFQLTQNEWEILKSQNVISSSHGGRRVPPYVFTEQGVAGLSGVIKCDIAAKVHVAIMRAFISLRKFIKENQLIYHRLDKIEQKQLESNQQFEKIFKALEKRDTIPDQGIFFDGQIFDAYSFASDLIRSAKISLILIDNYIDENTITQLTKKNKDVEVLILTKNVSKQLNLDIRKANEQYKNFRISQFDKSHDRFLIIDYDKIFHLGASLKDLGKKWFAFSLMDKKSVEIILKEIMVVPDN